jgi:drug/metabolite transporter (DMT)-like permease
LSTAQLFSACVAIWGSTWLAITFQLGRVPAEASVFYRFLLAAVLIFAWRAARRERLGLSAREHAWIALQGVLMFSVSYLCVYYAEQHVVSGLVAIGYSASPLLAMLGMRAFFGTPMTPPVVAGSILGIAGIALVFWPELAHWHAGGNEVALGAIFTVVAVVLSSMGSLVAHRNHQHDYALWPSMSWGMLYGSLFSLAVTLALGRPLVFDPSARYVASLLYLSVLGSIVTFAAYLTVMKRVGAARAGYIGVMTPVVALVISAAFEGFRWQALTFVGIAVTVLGNVVILRERERATG